MKPEDIQITDWMRILMGEVPWSFLLESVLRITFIYVLLLVVMRLMGRRMASLMSRVEMAGLVSLAAAIGVPMQDPNRGLLPAVIIAAVVILTQQVIGRYSLKNEHFEQQVKDDIAIMVKDGTLQLSEMKESRFSHERLFAQLRYNQISHLGLVQRVYQEANGDFSILRSDQEQPGLSILPDWDSDYKKQTQETIPDTYACTNCGTLQQIKELPGNACDSCRHQTWRQAVIMKEVEK